MLDHVLVLYVEKVEKSSRHVQIRVFGLVDPAGGGVRSTEMLLVLCLRGGNESSLWYYGSRRRVRVSVLSTSELSEFVSTFCGSSARPNALLKLPSSIRLAVAPLCCYVRRARALAARMDRRTARTDGRTDIAGGF